jgi:hypothetical protein
VKASRANEPVESFHYGSFEQVRCDDWRMTDLNALHNHLQKASSEAAAVEDLSVRRALLSLVEAVKLVAKG